MTFAILLGLLAGIFSGIIPAVGNFTTIILFIPLLTKFNVYELVLFYMTLTAISQYVCSIPAILFGIPGETSSIPVVQESKNLSWSEKVEALVGCAYGSFIGTVSVFVCIYVFSSHIERIVQPMFTSYILASMLCVSLIAICLVSNKSAWFSVFNAMLGAGLALIGINTFFNIHFTFGFSLFSGGIPDILVITFLLGFPELYQNAKIQAVNLQLTQIDHRPFTAIVLPKWYVSLSATVVGALGGIVPGLTFIASSSIAHTVSKWANVPALQRIFASESANNAGSVTQLLPLLLFAIPISGGEALILMMLNQQAFSVSTYSFSSIYDYVGYNFLIVNMLGLAITLALSYAASKVTRINVRHIVTFAMIVMVSSIMYESFSKGVFLNYVLISVFLLPLGWVLRNRNNMPLVFSFLVFDRLTEAVYRVFIL